MPIYPAIFITIFSIGTFLNLFIGPIYGLAVYYFTYFNLPEFQWWHDYVPQLRWSLIAASMLVISCIFHSNDTEKIVQIIKSPFKYLLMINLFSYLTLTFSYSNGLSYIYFIQFMKYTLIYFLTSLVITSTGKIKAILYIFLLLYLNIAILGHHYFDGSRLDGVGLSDAKDANLLSALLILIIPIIIQFIFFGKIYEKIFSIIVAIPVLNLFMMCRSRGGAVGIAVSFFVLFVLQCKKENMFKIATVVLVIILIFFRLMGAEYRDRLFDLSSSLKHGKAEQSSAGRMSIWIHSLNIIKDYPFGVSGGGFLELSPHYLPTELLSVEVGKRACHNTYLLFLIEQGPVGLILYLTFIFTTLKFLFNGRSIIIKINKLASRKEIDENNFLLSQIIALISSLSGFWTASFFIDRIYFEGIYIFSSLAVASSLIVSNKVATYQEVPQLKSPT